MTAPTRAPLPRWMSPERVDRRLWHPSLLPYSMQLASAEANGHHALAALIRELDAEQQAAYRVEPTVEDAVHTLLRTLHRDGAQPLPMSLSPIEHTALWTLLRRGTLTVEGGKLDLADDLATWDEDRLVTVCGEYPQLEDLALAQGVGVTADTVHGLLEKGRGT